ncbi:hypothetical protein GCM10028826_27590 [Mucilaginibacter boryungensis]
MVLGLSAAISTGYASDKTTPGYNEVINNYIDSYINGNYKKLDKVLSDDACVKIPRADVVLVHSKSKLLEKMKGEGNITQNCESEYKVLDKSDAMIIAKVDFKYREFTQHNYLVLEKDENKEWKITQVCRFFQDVKQPNAETAPNVTASK